MAPKDKEQIEKINLTNNGIFIIIDGKIEILDVPPNGHGKQTVTWSHGKPINIENYFTKKI